MQVGLKKSSYDFIHMTVIKIFEVQKRCYLSEEEESPCWDSHHISMSNKMLCSHHHLFASGIYPGNAAI